MAFTRTVGPLRALAIYLQDHHAGAQAGLALARRAAANQAATSAGPVLGRLIEDIEQDEAALEQVMDQVGARPSPLKRFGAIVLERAGRFKANGQLLGDSPLSPVIELEGLLSGIKSKQHVWMLLRDTVGLRLSGVDAQHMIDRADDQLDRLHEVWFEAAARAFPDRDGRPS